MVQGSAGSRVYSGPFHHVLQLTATTFAVARDNCEVRIYDGIGLIDRKRDRSPSPAPTDAPAVKRPRNE